MKKFKEYIDESMAARLKTRWENKTKQLLSRDRDNEYVGNELAKHDINVLKFHPPVDSGDKEGTLQTKVSVHIDNQPKAREIIKSLGYHKTHFVSSPTTAGGRWEEVAHRKNSTIRWTGD